MNTKQTVSLLLVLILLCCFFTTASAELTEFDATSLSKVDATAKDWTQNSDFAALASLLILNEFTLSTSYSMDDINFECGAVVARLNSITVLANFALKNGKNLYLAFVPSNNTAYYSIDDMPTITSSSDMRISHKAVKELDGVTNSYYLSYGDLLDMMSTIVDNSK